MLTCYIVDDELHAIDILKNYLFKTPNTELIGYNQNPLVALTEINEKLPDIAFIDINMPHLSGLECSNLINKEVSIIFTTAHAEYAVDAFTLNAYDFLLKPVKYERFLQTIFKVAERRSQKQPTELNSFKEDHIFIHSGLKGQMIRIDLNDIVYIESLNNSLVFHLKQEKHVAYVTLKELIQVLPANNFSRIHKSVIVNTSKIKGIESNQVVINEKLRLTIGQAYKEDFFNKLSKNTVKK
jgi:two-component system LytT family response regulator